MKKNLTKLLAVLLCIVLASFTLAGCKKSEPAGGNDEGGGDVPKQEELKKVTLNVYQMGEEPADMTKFYEELNKLTEKDLNATVKFSFSTWTDWSNKYNLMLASGEPMDMVYAANWTQYNSYVLKDAYLPLDEMLPKYAPDVWALIAEDRWNGVKVKGKIYGVPNDSNGFVQHGATFREDLRLKYNLPEIKDLDTLEQYIETVKNNEPDMNIPVRSSDPIREIFVPTSKYEYVDSQDAWGPTMGMLVADPNNPTQLVSIFDTSEYKAMLVKMKSWADKGFWSKSVLSSQDDDTALFQTGKAAVIIGHHPAKCKGTAEAVAKTHPDWKIGYFHYNDTNGYIHYPRATQDLTCVPKNSPNPERALMLLNKFMTDRTYYDLTHNGILGLNYNLTSDGALDFSAIDTKVNGFDIAPWAWGNSKLARKNKDDWPGYQPIMDRLTKVVVPEKFGGMALDVTSVQTEIAGISQVYDQYAVPLHTGLEQNVDKAYETLMKRLSDAGFDKLKSTVEQQLKEYCESNGVK